MAVLGGGRIISESGGPQVYGTPKYRCLCAPSHLHLNPPGAGAVIHLLLPVADTPLIAKGSDDNNGNDDDEGSSEGCREGFIDDLHVGVPLMQHLLKQPAGRTCPIINLPVSKKGIILFRLVFQHHLFSFESY
jgi:hypothetical protein